MPLGAYKLNGLARYIITTAQGKTVSIVGSGAIVNYGRIGSSYYNQDGRGWIEIAQSNDFAFGTSTDFTMEGWFWHGGDTSNRYFWDGRSDSNSVAVLYDGVQIKAYIAGAYRLFGSSTLEPNTWHHVAYTRSGTTGTLWVNGVSAGTWTDTTNYTHSNSIKVLSRFVFGQGSFNSYCDEFRISNIARYTNTFTPTTTGFSSDANTLLLLHLDSGTTVRTPKTITANGDVRILTTQSQFGGQSAYFDGNGDYLSVSPTTDFSTGTGDFTTEFWVRFSNTTTAILFDTRPAGTQGNYPVLYWSSSTIRYYQNGADRITSSSLSTATWYHVALVRSGNDYKLYINGTQAGSTYTNSASLSASQAVIGADAFAIGTSSLTGYIDEFRFSNTARYTANFTTPTASFTNDSNTVLLMHMGGFSNFFFDDGGYNNLTDSTGSAYSSPGAGNTPPYPTTVSVRTTNTSTASTIQVPTATKPGDLLVLFDTSTTTTDTTPSTWIQISGTTTTGIRTNISYKIATDTDPGATITGMAGTTRKVLIVYQGNHPFTSARFSPTIGAQSTTATPTNQTISLSGVTTPLIALAAYASTGAITTRGWSVGSPTEYSSFSTSGVYVKSLTFDVGSSPSNTTISMSDGGTNTLQSFYIRPF